jgi:hypothetical protein
VRTIMARLKRVPSDPGPVPVASDSPRQLLGAGSLDPRWVIMPGAMKPAMRHVLMCGPVVTPRRLPGWSEAVMASGEEQRRLCALHRAELEEEAADAGFVPFSRVLVSGEDMAPDDPAREAWSTAFCERWGY